ncbi:type III secretion protein [Pseudomonas sp. FP453]|jgi:hypothetical protein|uniref:type III secretion protein n=1 Tax=Pseudomonas sp. FP453 TaxID=2954094 RepID=UPI0027354B06|nr:type III secretion protein [Pseudomonas sp. FP453]WLH91152.1 type III secretion protein [Pseudomonas sp. FP453]
MSINALGGGNTFNQADSYMSRLGEAGGGGGGGGSEGAAEAIYQKLLADSIKNGWKSAVAKDIQAVIRAGNGQ